MNAINYKKLEAIEAQRPLKVSDIFLAADYAPDPVNCDEFNDVDRALIEKAINEGYIVKWDATGDFPGPKVCFYSLTTKGLALIAKHMK